MVEEPKAQGDELTVVLGNETLPGITESNKKRVWLGLVIGGILFVSLVVAIIILVQEGTEYKPIPPVPKPVIVAYNPYVMNFFHNDHKGSARAILMNNRTFIENGTTLGDPIVKNDSKNLEVMELVVMFTSIDDHMLNVRYIDPERHRWIPPQFARDHDPYEFTSNRIRRSLALGGPVEGNLFWWSYHGKSVDILPLVTTEQCRLQFFDKYVEFEVRLQTDSIFGLGERVESFVLENGNYSLWNTQEMQEYHKDPSNGTYGSHPFFLNRLKNKKDFIAIFMRNSNAMLFSFWYVLNVGAYANFKMLGGIIDLFVFHDADPDYLLKKYHSLIGRPYLPPVWAMGFQQARRGYDLSTMQQVVDAYQTFLIPIDAIWADVDINEAGKSFTVDPTAFKGIKDFVKKLHDPKAGLDMHFVAIANPGLKAEANYKYYEKAKTEHCLIMSALKDGQPFEGRTAAGPTVWLDYFQHSALLVWSEGLHDFHELTDFDGIWISENEPAQLCDGECPSGTIEDRTESIPNPFHDPTEFDNIPFRPMFGYLNKTTLPLTAYHAADDMYHKQYYTHNLFGIQTAEATYKSLESMFEDRRFLVASRSTWPGSGHFGSHWIDKVNASWPALLSSIPAMLNFNMFGIPHIGSAIGGYFGNVDKELLLRWYALGALSPLMLTYGSKEGNAREAYAYKDILEMVRHLFFERYKLLRFIYTKMFEAHAWGGPVIHPLFFDFPEESECYTREVVDYSFMWAKTLYVIPAVIKGQNVVRAYLPNWRWYDLKTYEMVTDYKVGHVGDYLTFSQSLGEITILLKGGSIIPVQILANAVKVMNVEDLKKIPAFIVIAPDHTGRATGSMVVDAEGIRPYPERMSNTYRHYSFTYMNQIFRINKVAGFDFHEEYEFDYFWEILILDVFGQHDVSFVCMMDTNYHKKQLHYFHPLYSSSLIIYDDRRAKMSMRSLESIVWGTPQQHDFCQFQAKITKITYADEGRTLLGELATSDPEALQLKFDLKASLLTQHIISMQISMVDSAQPQWVVPDVVEDTVRRTFKTNTPITESGFKTSPINEPFMFEMGNPEDLLDFVFTTRNLPFVYVRNFMHFKFMVNSRHIFGLGERIHKFELEDGVYSLFNFDSTSIETGLPPGNNMWGSHAFYLIHLHRPTQFAGVFFLNSNPLDLRIRHVGMQTQIDHLFVGGIIDAFFFQSASVQEVLQNYHYVIGKPAPVPYWAFGYHQCRWGYRSIEQLQEVERNFDRNNLPLDALWLDKDYMKDERDFTIDEARWFTLTKYVDLLHIKGLRVVMLIDPAFAIDDNYEPYRSGLQADIFIKSSFTNQSLVGVSWPGYAVYIDFLHPAASGFWENSLAHFHARVAFDGLWLDMNEPSSFCDGECADETHFMYYNFPLDFYDDLYYNPSHRALETATLSMEALHYSGRSQEPEFNYHNLYGLLQSRITARYFSSRLNTRPFVLSSSTFPSSGSYVGHWIGDNYSSWHWMEYSLAGVFNFQMFGVAFAGADICGFNGNATIPLCSRWMQLGAFYPMMRNHNSMYSNPQEPYIDAKLAGVFRASVLTRYALARYLYTLHMRVVLHGGVYVYPVLFEFPSDLKTYSLLDSALMFGPALRLTPVLEDNVRTLTSYFPNHDWYELQSFRQVVTYNQSRHEGYNLTLECSLESQQLNLHIKGGSIFPYQVEAITTGFSRITKMQDHPVILVIAPQGRAEAVGHVYYDEDSNLNYREGEYQEYLLHLVRNVLTITLAGGNPAWRYSKNDASISSIQILDAKEYENIQCARVYDTAEHQYKTLLYAYSSNNNVLTLTPQNAYPLLFSNIANISWHHTPC